MDKEEWNNLAGDYFGQVVSPLNLEAKILYMI